MSSASERGAGARTGVREHRFADRETAAAALAAAVAGRLVATLAERPDPSATASLVVSGGSTPRPFFTALRQRELPWEQVRITLADERWVGREHADSNERLVRRELLVDRAATATFVGFDPLAAPSPAAAAEEVERRLAGWVPFDAVVLGLGADGHTASLFPEARELPGALDLSSERICVAVDPPAAAHRRLTLTAAALVTARFLALHLHGEDKWEVLERALAPGPVEDLPVRAMLRWATAGVDVYWAP